MSGDGGPLPCASTRALAAPVEIERKACSAHLRAKAGEVRGLAGKRGLSAHETSILARRLEAAADEIDAGLHA